MSWLNYSNFPTSYDLHAIISDEHPELPVLECSECGAAIYEGDTYYELCNGQFVSICFDRGGK